MSVLFYSLCLYALMAASPSPATAQSAIYRDPDLRFAFRYPAGLRVDEAVRQKSLSMAESRVPGDSDTSKALGCLHLRLSAAENPGTTTFRMIAITRLDLDCRKERVRDIKLNELTERALRTAMTVLGHPVVGKASGYRVAGHIASVVEGSIDPQGSMSKGPILGETTCEIIEHSVVCFSSLGSDRMRVRQVLEGGITFEGKEEQPLVSAGLLPP